MKALNLLLGILFLPFILLATTTKPHDVVAEGGTLTTDTGLTALTICAGDGTSDAFDVILTGATGQTMIWILTDTDGVILGTPPGAPFDLENAGAGVCLLQNLSFDGGIDGLAVGNNIANLLGDFDFSNPITITRIAVSGGTLLTADGQFSIETCSGDGNSDLFDVSLTNNSGENEEWIFTDTDDNIIEIGTAPPFEFEGTGSGVLKIWNVSYATGLTGLTVGQNIANLDGCFDLSSSILVNRKGINGGDLTTSDGLTEFSICTGDGDPDPFQIILTNQQGTVPHWVITDESLNILALPLGPPFDLEGAGSGICQLWYLSSHDEIVNLAVGNNVADLQGCYDLSNPITVNRTEASGGNLSTNLGETELFICAGSTDLIDVTLTGDSGANSAWVITDPNLEILELPLAPPFDFSGAGEGVCLIWHLSFDTVTGAEVGMNANDLDGCFGLSNAITVTRSTVMAGTITLTDLSDDLSICAGDGVADPFDVILTGGVGDNTGWVITDPSGEILGLPAGPPFDLEGAGDGSCLVRHISYGAGVTGLALGNNLFSDITGCYEVSNPITVFRSGVSGGQLTTGNGETDLTICANDGVSDAFAVILTGNQGTAAQWVITDSDLNILALPAAPPFDLEGAGAGVCQVWYLSYTNALTGLAVGGNVADVTGCFALSNPITVERQNSVGGTISLTDGSTTTTICAGDGNSDAFDVIENGISGQIQRWVITDTAGEILGLPSGPPFDLEGAGEGTCLVWSLSHGSGLTGLSVGNNATTDLLGCYEFSNPITVVRDGVNGGDLAIMGGADAITICAGDGVSDAFNVTLTDNIGQNSAWVITDSDLNILALPAAPPFDLEGAGVGVCLIWNLSFETGLTGAVVGANAADLSGCYDLSNPITVTRSNAVGGSLAIMGGGDAMTICAGDGVSDAFDVTLTGNVGQNSGWVITDTAGDIIAVPAGPPFDLEGAGDGVCVLWHVSYADGLMGLTAGNNANTDLVGCYELSNPITVTRNGVNGGDLAIDGGTDEISICAGDGVSDAFDVTLTNVLGQNSAWVITDADLNILALPAAPPFDLEGAGEGVCLIWHLSFEDGLTGAVVGDNAADLAGCFSLSNPITVTRTEATGGNLALIGGGDVLDICAGDGISDAFDVMLTDNVGQNSGWVITDASGMILALPAGPPFDLEGAGGGTCLVWHISYNDGITGLAMGNNATSDLGGCYALSNAITVNRSGVNGGNLATDTGLTALTICAGDAVADAFDVTLSDQMGTNSAWVITDSDLNILDLPAGPPFDLEGAGVGVCLIWHLSFEDGLTGAAVGENAANLAGCFALSNPITVTRTFSVGGALTTLDGATELTICAGDGESDAFDVVLTGNEGQFSGWVITDASGMILGLPAAPPFELEFAGGGVCYVRHISYSTLTTGLAAGNNLSDLSGCYELSDAIVVTRMAVGGGTIATDAGETEITICVGDDIVDEINVVLTDHETTADAAWVITNYSGTILGLPTSSPFEFEGAGEGVCYLWHLTSSGELLGLELDQDGTELIGCHNYSNPIIVNRVTSGAACPVSVSELLEGESLTLYPNPAKDVVRIEFQTAVQEEVLIDLINPLGIHVLRNQVLPGNGVLDWQLADLPKGIYMVKMVVGDRSLVRQLVID